MNVASLVSSEWSATPRSNPYPSQPSPAASLSGSVRKFDEYHERPSPITTYFSAVNSSNTKTSTQLPLSPPADDPRKCSLPSISSLLEGVDCMPASKRQRHNSNEYSRIFLPPTPPMRPSSSFTERSSPSGRSHSASISSAVSHPQTSLPPLSTSLPTPSASSAERASSLSISSLASQDMPSPAPTTTSTATITTPSASSTTTSSSYYTSPPSSSSSAAPAAAAAPEEQSYSHKNTSTPATPAAAPPAPAMVSPVNPGWQHHHYFPISTAAASYPQNHERYVCRTCHKAFSRPSSLRIHSHSHTGEKPFRCTHAGCGKAFSVRSNMKRHERGCHSGRPLAATALV